MCIRDRDNIECDIKNAMGKDQSDYKSMTYEGYGPHGIAVFVDTLTAVSYTHLDVYKRQAKAHVIAIRRILEKTQKEKVEVFYIGIGPVSYTHLFL